MPLKITTETDLIRLLSNSPLQMEVDFMKIKGHQPKNTPIEHMQQFYKDFDAICDDFYDGMIITGAPVEQLLFEDVTYWEELKTIMNWSRTHVTSTLYICWAAQAGLYHFYGIPKYELDTKKSSCHRIAEKRAYFCDGFASCIGTGYSPASDRYTEPDAVENNNGNRPCPSAKQLAPADGN